MAFALFGDSFRHIELILPVRDCHSIPHAGDKLSIKISSFAACLDPGNAVDGASAGAAATKPG